MVFSILQKSVLVLSRKKDFTRNKNIRNLRTKLLPKLI